MACREADARDRQVRVNSTSWAVGPGNVAPMAGLEQAVRQQAAKSRRRPKQNLCPEAGVRMRSMNAALQRFPTRTCARCP